MAGKRPTPEEELLNLIEKEGEAATTRFKHKRKFSLGLTALKSLPSSLGADIFKGLQRFGRGIREPNLKVLNKIFFVVVIALLGYFISDFGFDRPDMEEIWAKSRKLSMREGSKKETTRETRAFLHYLEMVNRRNIFSPVTLKKEAKKPEVEEEQLHSMAQELSLVGISWDAKTPLAMIEDKKSEKTYFLKKGEAINRFRIEDILKDKVILTFEGKKIELM